MPRVTSITQLDPISTWLIDVNHENKHEKKKTEKS